MLGTTVADAQKDATGDAVKSVADKVNNLKEQLETLKALIGAIEEGRNILDGGEGEIEAAKTKITGAKGALNEEPANAIATLWKEEAGRVIAQLVNKEKEDEAEKANKDHLTNDLKSKTAAGEEVKNGKPSKEALEEAKDALKKAHSAADGKGVDPELMGKAAEVIKSLEKLITDYKSGDPKSCIKVTDKCKATQRRLASVASLSPLGASRSPAGAPRRLAEIVHSVLGRNHSHAAASQGAHGFPLVRRLTAPFRKALSRALRGSARGKAHRVALGNDCCVAVKCNDDSISDEAMCPEKGEVAFVRRASDKPVKSKEEAGTECCVEDPLNAELNNPDSPWQKSGGVIGLKDMYSQISFAPCTYTTESIWACAGGDMNKKPPKAAKEQSDMKSGDNAKVSELILKRLKIDETDGKDGFPKYKTPQEGDKITKIGTSLKTILNSSKDSGVTLHEVIVKGEIKAGNAKVRPVAVFTIAVARAYKVLRGLAKTAKIDALEKASEAARKCVIDIYKNEGTMTGADEAEAIKSIKPAECQAMVGVSTGEPQIRMRFRYT